MNHTYISDVKALIETVKEIWMIPGNPIHYSIQRLEEAIRKDLSDYSIPDNQIREINDRTIITFKLPSGRKINICLREDKLLIQGETAIIIEPFASNNIKINSL